MNKKNLIIDITLAIVILVMGVIIYREISRMAESMRVEPEVEMSDGQADRISPAPSPAVPEVQPTEVPRMDFKLQDLEDNTISVSDFHGTAVMVNFWATWCPPCRDEMPLIQEYADQFAGDLVVLAVNAGEDEATVRSFIEEYELDLIFLLDPTNVVAKLYRVIGYPTTMFIDQDGVLRATHIGELNETLLLRYLAEIGIDE